MSTADPSAGPERKVLVVDDSLPMHRLYASVLESRREWNIRALFACDGTDGLAQLRRHPDTALVLLDINMPRMCGFEFLRLAKLEPLISRIPVVLQSSETDQGVIERGLAAGARAYMVKPFTPSRLVALLKEILG